MNKSILIIVIGILIRLALMPFTSHPDLRGHYLGASFITQHGEYFTFYDHISKLPRDNPIVQLYKDDFLVYSPLTYQIHAAWLSIVSPVFPWDTFNLMEIDMTKASFESNFPYLIFLLKIPYLLADLGCLFILLKIIKPKDKVLCAALWSFNLPVLHSGFMMGQFDIFILLTLLMSIYFSEKNNPLLASISLALGAGFKPFSLFLLPLVPGKQIKNMITGGVAYLLLIAPYVIISPGYRMYALVAQHSDKLWFSKILVSGSQYIPLFFTVLFIIYWLKREYPKALSNLSWFILPLLAFYSLTHFHPQWFTWVSGFLIIILVRLRSSWTFVSVLLISWLLITFSFEQSLSFGLFNIDYSLKPFLNDQIISAIRGVIFSTSIILAIKLKSLAEAGKN